ncbi:MAG TPA: ABC transporter substrate-binding protein [Ramlibacter sp.]|uniref:ABC transporter substrate-binding protein n=1 Tax=Ramlibacter sp. TaxID=1917967 RepID=UPI002C2E39C5|nr:ABC transporter substrate-binding protein [Ramlibacter sp.]HVZ45499.1 ABC transporter substrate-binding protein [Ramlibacter sp.]
MTTKRILLAAGALLAVTLTLLTPAPALAQANLRTVKWGFAGRVINTAIVNFVIAEDLGFYREEGFHLEILPVGGYPPILDGLRRGTLDFGTVATPVLLPLLAKGENLPIRNYMEYLYPFKWSMVVRPDAKIQSLADLKGKRIGIPFFGSFDKEVGEQVLSLVGVKEQDVQWIATGDGTAGGIALQRNDVDALFTYDTHLAAIEAAGMTLRYLTLPSNLPKIGGWWLGARSDKFNEPEYRRLAIGFGRAIAKANIFTRENPEAAAYLFVKRYPETAPAGLSLPDSVKAVQRLVDKRAPLLAPYDESSKWGYTVPADLETEIALMNLKGKAQASQLWTNELVDEVNRFDANQVKKLARDFVLPYKR